MKRFHDELHICLKRYLLAKACHNLDWHHERVLLHDGLYRCSCVDCVGWISRYRKSRPLQNWYGRGNNIRRKHRPTLSETDRNHSFYEDISELEDVLGHKIITNHPVRLRNNNLRKMRGIRAW